MAEASGKGKTRQSVTQFSLKMMLCCTQLIIVIELLLQNLILIQNV